jgi:hypothetical protein
MTTAPAHSPETMELALRLAGVVEHLREEGSFNLEQWLAAAERGMGGTFILQAPHKRTKREVPEARYFVEGTKIQGEMSFG